MVKGRSASEQGKRQGRIRHRKMHASVVDFGDVTAYGGLGLMHHLLHRTRARAHLEEAVEVLRVHRGYDESDHLLHLTSAIYAGATCIDDLSVFKDDEAYKRLLGVRSVPDPSTMGDFMRRFGRSDMNDYKTAVWQMQEQVWSKLRKGQRKRATLDLDAKICPVYGRKKRGADYDYKRTFSYHPEMLSIAETGEWLDAVNRPGNEKSGDRAAYLLRRNLPRVTPHFGKVCVRGDSKYGRCDVVQVCHRHGVGFAVGWQSCAALQTMAEELPAHAWTALERDRPSAYSTGCKRRKRRRNVRRMKARKRGYKDKKLKREAVAEFPYTPVSLRGKVERPYRMIVIRKQVEVAEKTALFDVFEYRFILTDLRRKSHSEIVHFAYGRCNQENLIEQAKNGVSAFRMPTGDLLPNEVWMFTAMLAHNLKSWLSLLALGIEKLAWEWKRFRLHFVYVLAAVTRRSRQLFVQLDRRCASTPVIFRGLAALGASVT
jgi:hypothetical protein